MPRKKVLEPETMKMAPENTDAETEMESAVSGLEGALGPPDSETDISNPETETQHDENDMLGPGNYAGTDENPPVDETDLEAPPEEGAFSEDNEPISETDTDHIDPIGETEMQGAISSAAAPAEKPHAPNPEADMETPKRKRGRPKKKAAQDTSPEPEIKTKIKTPRKTTENRILAIGETLSAEPETSKQDSELLDLAESLNGYRILSGVIQGIEQTEAGNHFAVIYYGGYKIIIPTEELIIMPKDIGDRDPIRVMHYLLNKRLGAEIDFVIKGLDQQARIAAASRAEAMARKRKRYFHDTDRDGNHRIYEGLCAEARVVSVKEVLSKDN